MTAGDSFGHGGDDGPCLLRSHNHQIRNPPTEKIPKPQHRERRTSTTLRFHFSFIQQHVSPTSSSFASPTPPRLGWRPTQIGIKEPEIYQICNPKLLLSRVLGSIHRHSLRSGSAVVARSSGEDDRNLLRGGPREENIWCLPPQPPQH